MTSTNLTVIWGRDEGKCENNIAKSGSTNDAGISLKT